MPRKHPEQLMSPEDVVEFARPAFDFENQRRVTTQNGRYVTIYISKTCAECGHREWLSRTQMAHQKVPYCVSCSRKKMGKNKGNGRRIGNGGYVIVDITRFYKDNEEYIRKYLNCYGGTIDWFLEHRVVALLKYGPKAALPGVFVRHKDGNPENCHPDNLLLGLPRDNSMDHRTAINEMIEWRETAFALWEMLIRA